MAMTEPQSPVLFKNIFQVTFQKLMSHCHCFFFRCARSSIHTHWFLALDFHNNQFPDNQFLFSPLLTILHCQTAMDGVLLANVLADVLLSLFSLSQLGGCRQRTAGVAWEELQGKASPPPTPTLTLTLLLPHHLQTKSRHGTPLTLRGWKELLSMATYHGFVI